MTRTQLEELIDDIQTGVPNTALKVRTALKAIADGTDQTGDVKEIDVSNAYLESNFDSSGLGKNERLGWAICNGNNGTRNRGGRTSIQYSSVYPVLGSIGGSPTHTLSENEMPSHNHTGHVVKASNDWRGGGESSGDNATSTTGATLNKGGNLPHNNMQPYIVSLFIMKL